MIKDNMTGQVSPQVAAKAASQVAAQAASQVAAQVADQGAAQLPPKLRPKLLHKLTHKFSLKLPPLVASDPRRPKNSNKSHNQYFTKIHEKRDILKIIFLRLDKESLITIEIT